MSNLVDIENDKSMYGLNCWSKHLVEKLGWMMIKADKEPKE